MINKVEAAFELFDSYNQGDPVTYTWNNEVYPQEYFLAIQLHKWILVLDPEASEELLLASRSQHIGRWEISRDQYPEGRKGYLAWRRDLALFHADTAAAIMKNVGYGEEQISRVKQIILKQKIKVDHEVQTMENALCLVFLQFQYEDFFPRYSPEKIVNILKKSLLKMDSNGHRHALQLQYSQTGRDYIQRALNLIA